MCIVVVVVVICTAAASAAVSIFYWLSVLLRIASWLLSLLISFLPTPIIKTHGETVSVEGGGKRERPGAKLSAIFGGDGEEEEEIAPEKNSGYCGTAASHKKQRKHCVDVREAPPPSHRPQGGNWHKLKREGTMRVSHSSLPANEPA